MDAAQPPLQPSSEGKPVSTAPAAVVIVKDLQVGEQKITMPSAVLSSIRQRAQRANDRGLQLYKEKQYSAAEAQFTEALKLHPDYALAANNLGFVYYKQDKFKEAVRWFENTIRMDPSRAIAYLNLGDAQANLGEKAKAKQAYHIYVELSPNSASVGYARQQLNKL